MSGLLKGRLWALDDVEAGQADGWVHAAFAGLRAAPVTCFARTWTGRVFAMDRNRGVVVVVDPGVGQVQYVPVLFDAFADYLMEHRSTLLDEPLLREWLAAGGSMPDGSSCVGYKVPLFLGGEAAAMNLERLSVDVHWTVTGQVIAQFAGEPYDFSYWGE